MVCRLVICRELLASDRPTARLSARLDHPGAAVAVLTRSVRADRSRRQPPSRATLSYRGALSTMKLTSAPLSLAHANTGRPRRGMRTTPPPRRLPVASARTVGVEANPAERKEQKADSEDATSSAILITLPTEAHADERAGDKHCCDEVDPDYGCCRS